MAWRHARAAAALLTAVSLGTEPASADSGSSRFWRSMAVPGWGQHAAGHPSARRFLAVEAMLWLGYGGLREVADIRAGTYRTYAATHAQAQTDGKDRQYFDDLGFYGSHQQHNRFAIVDDGAAAELYPSTVEFAWEWDGEASRERYRQLRNDAQSMDRNALYLTGLVVVNHLVAAVHAARLDGDAVEDGAAVEASSSPGHLALHWQLLPGGARLALQRRF